MTLYALGAVTVHGYRVRTGDRDTDTLEVTGALVEAESLMEEELRRLLPLESRTEVMRIFRDGRVYPKAYPVTVSTTLTIDGRSLVYASPDSNPFLGLFLSIERDPHIVPRMTVVYTGGFDATTFPITLRNALYDIARGLAAERVPVPVGARSISVGDVSVTFGSSDDTGSALDELAPGVWKRIRKYRNRLAT